jgi:glycosyltransferase involved in cell wall biosynthesis
MTMISVIIPMYNAAEHIAETLQSVSSQSLPVEWQLEIIVVNDGSSDRSPQIAAAFPDHRIVLIDREDNRGRARARNLGIEAATGSFCLFLDADCSYADPDTIGQYIREFESGIQACFGAVTAKGDGFWERYQRGNVASRIAHQEWLSLVTTQNLGIAREVLLRIGCFDTRYRYYGFEDRDLYLTAARYLGSARTKINPAILVYHRDRLSMEQVCRKMFAAGRYSALRFKEKFPREYLRMAYAKVDYDLMPAKWRPLLRFLLRRRKLLLILGRKVLQAPILPYGFKRLSVKGLSACYYMAGTCRQAGKG